MQPNNPFLFLECTNLLLFQHPSILQVGRVSERIKRSFLPSPYRKIIDYLCLVASNKEQIQVYGRQVK